MDHEEVAIRRGRRSGLTMVIAAHSRVLGPAVGGVRLRRYDDWRDGVEDALRLSEAMTYKCAAANLPFGGGKSVLVADGAIIGDAREAALADLGEFIADLDGSYLAGPDVGTGPADMAVLRRWTPHVFCLPEDQGGTGSSSGPTALGVLAALRAGTRAVFGDDSLAARTVVISGLGSVGTYLARHLAAAGAKVLVSDVDDRKRALAEEWGLGWVEPTEALSTSADILVPAGVGGVVGLDTEFPLIVGPANNQLTLEAVADELARRGVVWIPDFVASAGGVVYTLGREVERLTHDQALARVAAIESTVDELLAAARARGTTPLAEAMGLARDRLEG
ncbi:MAG TPA: Glu/Leu/Phe/Val dehydrogenase dimerization domain-containing protein [Amycolatopsis sp.]|uniref:Glu/Leu/Phe/Val dehydrogenase dimerization domain-containing protein n=1 Tax=Amycolatopsis sp. TaxID=37632 RepID=UPI002B48FD82|nr:Glu/Leu/Phe/Val dehydrogenase dimerization domain-containing protein [Amycolatopsis sp.]HKS43610.1 Glu/Leu/Phe/Val dehydrogenase dimerization domain-containing protein [Amycolatopsis sp.]